MRTEQYLFKLHTTSDCKGMNSRIDRDLNSSRIDQIEIKKSLELNPYIQDRFIQMILRLSTIEISSISVHPKNHDSVVESELTMVLFKKARLGLTSEAAYFRHQNFGTNQSCSA